MSARQQLQVRLPIALHAQLVKQAAQQDVSLNSLLVSLLASASGFSLSEYSDDDLIVEIQRRGLNVVAEAQRRGMSTPESEAEAHRRSLGIRLAGRGDKP